MQRRNHVLCYGNDAFLMEIRQLLLQRAGFKVANAAAEADFERLVESEYYDLLILCHSLDAENCEQAIMTAHRHRPKLKTLILDAGRKGCHGDLLDQVLSAMEGPRALLATVDEMLGSPLRGEPLPR